MYGQDKFFILLCILHLRITLLEAQLPPCDNDIYCKGDLLHTVQLAQLYPDSKTFVDMKLKSSPATILEKFKDIMQKNNQRPSKQVVKDFVNAHFDDPGSEFVKFEPTDWVKKPKFLERINDERYRDWAEHLNTLWFQLGRKMTDDVKNNPDRYSIIYVPNPVIVPGGRFREFYYWDSYWIILGLLHSQMLETVKGMLDNFIEIVNKYSLIPNGGRIYYTRRSQPPLFIPMMKKYYDYSQDIKYIESNIQVMENEFTFWLKNRMQSVTIGKKTIQLARYKVDVNGPRPESYREDFESASVFKTQNEKEGFYRELKGACESGWDFSSRWFIQDGTNKGNLTNIKLSSIIPVDLNAMLYGNARILVDLSEIIQDETRKSKYTKYADDLKEAITLLLWDDAEGMWFDYDYVANKPRKYFYASNFTPLWTRCYDQSDVTNLVKKVMAYIEKVHAISVGGVPTSFESSGEQWDRPNAWPPLQHIIIEGLYLTGVKEAKLLAEGLAAIWLRTNYKHFHATGSMYEKYDAVNPSATASGGEYEVQLGFGWTNGVCMDLLNLFGHTVDSADPATKSSGSSSIMDSNQLRIVSLSIVYQLLFTLAITVHNTLLQMFN